MTVADIDWLKTVVAEVGDRGVERPSQTIAPDRGQSADVLVAHVSSLSRDRPLVFKEIIAEGGMGTVRRATQSVLAAKSP